MLHDINQFKNNPLLVEDETTAEYPVENLVSCPKCDSKNIIKYTPNYDLCLGCSSAIPVKDS